MELRKNPDIDLERKRGMFFSIGLLVSLSLVITAFQWKTEVTVYDLPYTLEEKDALIFMEPVATIIHPPERPKPIERKSIQAPVFVETNVEIEEVLETIPEAEEIDFNDIIIDEPIKEEEPEVWTGIVEQMPEPTGGMASFYKFISKEMKYPSQARRMDIEGRVFVQFIVDRDGSLSNIEVIKGIGGGCDEEAARVLAKAPKWNPGKQRGKAVRVRMIVPIHFRLN
ncbi:energy transducer TonB [Reichenbachiella ulvae]|uniref:TonB family protein n=1 Tax=Reichenbachiella ulvae TaxID=2980104 RepID=A0ABT3CW69_9BACT|nr:energy transducer TonB [Reichenbachiella ulvae]MCV9387950.1 TonB family protein [Reichenbachiella ulvae]